MILNRSIHAFMTANPRTIRHDEKVHRATHVMDLHRIRYLPVKGPDGKLVGLLTDREARSLANYRYPQGMVVADLMIEQPLVARFDASIEEVIRTMNDFGHECALITNGHRNLAGLFTRGDAIQALLGAHQPQPAALRLVA